MQFETAGLIETPISLLYLGYLISARRIEPRWGAIEFHDNPNDRGMNSVPIFPAPKSEEVPIKSPPVEFRNIGRWRRAANNYTPLTKRGMELP